jgi:2,3-diketo-5-methylthiopentyl-1-phosphate enolase
MSAALIGAKLPRLAGVDMVISLTPYGKFPMLMDTFVDSGYKMLSKLGDIKPIFPMPGGGTTQGHVEDVVNKFGIDVIIASGAGIHAHPMGPRAGAKSFRQAIDAAVKGQKADEAAKEHEELRVALNEWGYYQEGKTGIFELKG